MKKANKGEWSEIYTLFKIAGEKQIYGADDKLNRIDGLCYPIIQIYNFAGNDELIYTLEDKITVKNITNGKEIVKDPSAFADSANSLLLAIQENKDTTFAVPNIQNLLDELGLVEIKANSKIKYDIGLTLYDVNTKNKPNVNFSIKSKLGNPSTLFNASQSTNFQFEIKEPIWPATVNDINNIDTKNKVRDRISAIISSNSLEFKKVKNQTFNRNLELIDSNLPVILANMLLSFYSGIATNITDLVQHLIKMNPLDRDSENKDVFYEYKIKHFLRSVALGMIPTVDWSGEYGANGGYIVVKENGDILCYYIYNLKDLEKYLISTTKLETPSTTRHKYGYIYEEGGKQYLDLNLQIRWID